LCGVGQKPLRQQHYMCRQIRFAPSARVLRKSARLKSVRSARPYETAVLFQNLVSVGFPLGLRPRPSKRCAFFGGYPAPIEANLAFSSPLATPPRPASIGFLPHRNLISLECTAARMNVAGWLRATISLPSSLIPLPPIRVACEAGAFVSGEAAFVTRASDADRRSRRRRDAWLRPM